MSQGSSFARPSRSRANASELRVVALGEGLRAPGEVAQEREHLVGAARHLRHERHRRVVRDSPAAWRPRAAARARARSARCCPTRAAPRSDARVACARCSSRAASRSSRVLHHGHEAGHAHRELPAVAAVGLRALARFRHDVVGNAGELARVVDVERLLVGGVEHVVVERRRQRRELLLDRLEARLPRRRAARRRPAGSREARCRRRWRCAASSDAKARDAASARYFAYSRSSWPSSAWNDADLRQVAVVGVADRRRVDDRVHVAQRAPRAVEPVERVGDRLGDGRPRRRARIGGDALDGRARVREQASTAGVACSGADRRRSGAGPRNRAADCRSSIVLDAAPVTERVISGVTRGRERRFERVQVLGRAEVGPGAP